MCEKSCSFKHYYIYNTDPTASHKQTNLPYFNIYDAQYHESNPKYISVEPLNISNKIKYDQTFHKYHMLISFKISGNYFKRNPIPIEVSNLDPII
jgi:hypothetical protein